MDQLHGLFVASVERDPQKVAFVTRTTCLTYGELYQRITLFAGALPRGPTGKVQRHRLREWHAQGKGTKLT